MKKKIIVSAIAIVLVLCCAIGGTLAWLTDATDPITNTFTVGNVDIDLAETTGEEYKMIPGNTITKDPTVTVLEGSEACYVFVKIDKNGDFDDYMSYEMADGWTQLDADANANVYWRTVNAVPDDANPDTDGIDFPVIKDNTITVSEDVTGITTTPTLTFTAYAVQSAKVETAADAWAIVNPPAQG